MPTMKMTKAKAKKMGGAVLAAYNAVPAKTKRKVGTRVAKKLGVKSTVRKNKKALKGARRVVRKFL